MSCTVAALFLARLVAAAEAPVGDVAKLQQTSRVVARRIIGESSQDAGGRLAAQTDRGATGTLHLRIVERRAGQVAPVPARVHIVDAGDKPVLAPGLPAWRDHFNCEGDVRLDLPPGPYTYTIERGPEYRRATGRIHPCRGRAPRAGGGPWPAHRSGVPGLVLGGNARTPIA